MEARARRRPSRRPEPISSQIWPRSPPPPAAVDVDFGTGDGVGVAASAPAPLASTAPAAIRVPASAANSVLRERVLVPIGAFPFESEADPVVLPSRVRERGPGRVAGPPRLTRSALDRVDELARGVAHVLVDRDVAGGRVVLRVQRPDARQSLVVD